MSTGILKYKLAKSVPYADGTFVIPAGQVMVREADYSALEADNAALREQVKAQSDSLLGQYRIVAEMQDRAITVERERDALRLKAQELEKANRALQDQLDGWELGSRGFP